LYDARRTVPRTFKPFPALSTFTYICSPRRLGSVRLVLRSITSWNRSLALIFIVCPPCSLSTNSTLRLQSFGRDGFNGADLGLCRTDSQFVDSLINGAMLAFAASIPDFLSFLGFSLNHLCIKTLVACFSIQFCPFNQCTPVCRHSGVFLMYRLHLSGPLLR
jgi:hypothetical protein